MAPEGAKVYRSHIPIEDRFLARRATGWEVINNPKFLKFGGERVLEAGFLYTFHPSYGDSTQLLIALKGGRYSIKEVLEEINQRFNIPRLMIQLETFNL